MSDVRGNQSKQDVRDDQDSLAPIQLDRLSVEDEAALMQSGKLGRLSMFAIAVVVVGAGTNFWLKRLDTHDAYVGAAAQVHELRTSTLEPFLRCALPQTDRSAVNSKERLISAIEGYSESMGKDYSRVLGRCTPMLGELPGKLAAVPGPQEVREQLGRLSASASELSQAVTTYRSYLSAAGSSYDYVQALPMMEKIALAWESYETRQSELDAQVRAAVD